MPQTSVGANQVLVIRSVVFNALRNTSDPVLDFTITKYQTTETGCIYQTEPEDLEVNFRQIFDQNSNLQLPQSNIVHNGIYCRTNYISDFNPDATSQA